MSKVIEIIGNGHFQKNQQNFKKSQNTPKALDKESTRTSLREGMGVPRRILDRWDWLKVKI